MPKFFGGRFVDDAHRERSRYCAKGFQRAGTQYMSDLPTNFMKRLDGDEYYDVLEEFMVAEVMPLKNKLRELEGRLEEKCEEIKELKKGLPGEIEEKGKMLDSRKTCASMRCKATRRISLCLSTNHAF